MKARDLIEAESAKEFVIRTRRAIPLAWDQIDRLMDILASGPLRRRPSDAIFIRLGLAGPYDGDPATIEGTHGAVKRFFDKNGSVRPEWILQT